MPRIPKVIGIVGSRRRNTEADFELCLEEFNKVYVTGDRLVSGGCPKGGDKFAEIIAQRFGLTITIHYPDWTRLGKVAGFERNTSIVEDCSILIALVAEDRTGGTEDSVRKAERMGKKIVLI